MEARDLIGGLAVTFLLILWAWIDLRRIMSVRKEKMGQILRSRVADPEPKMSPRLHMVSTANVSRPVTCWCGVTHSPGERI